MWFKGEDHETGEKEDRGHYRWTGEKRGRGDGTGGSREKRDEGTGGKKEKTRRGRVQ